MSFNVAYFSVHVNTQLLHFRSAEAWIVAAGGTYYTRVGFLVIIALDLVVAILLQVILHQGRGSLPESKQIKTLNRETSKAYFTSLEHMHQALRFGTKVKSMPRYS